MPVNQSILKKFASEYGKKKGKSVAYATANKNPKFKAAFEGGKK